MAFPSLTPSWCSAPRKLTLAPDELHIWRAQVDQRNALLLKFSNTETCDETERAKQFQVEQARARFLICRVILKNILRRYSNLEAGCLRFEYGRYGKPYLSNTDLRFNSSHSNNLALYAIGLGQEIGIETEYIRPVLDRDQIVDRYFTAKEKIMYGRLTPDAKGPAFFNGWTRKEAYLKATGVGLNQPLRTVEVSLEPGKPARLLRINGNPREADAWSLYELSLGTDYAGALAVKGRYRLRLWRWEQQG